LTFYKFDKDGKPFVFHLEHLPIIKRLPFYFIRKVGAANGGLRDALTKISTAHAEDRIRPLKPDLPDDFPDRQLLEALASGGIAPVE
jgi:hypothetical protein